MLGKVENSSHANFKVVTNKKRKREEKLYICNLE